MLKKIFKFILILFIILLICAVLLFFIGRYHKSKKPALLKQQGSKEKTLTIKPTHVSKTLYFSGIVKPVRKMPVISPTSGIIKKKFFKYGEIIKKGRLLFILDSYKRQADYQSALTKYLQAKQTDQQSIAKFEGDKKLFQKGLISKNEYTSSKNSFYLNKLALIQAQAQLQKSVRHKRSFQELQNLSIDDIDAVNKALRLGEVSQHINIYSPYNGIALFSSGTDESKKIGAGSEIKQNQTLLYIGPAYGLSMDISINEINVGQLHVGQPAIITSIAFPAFTLHGYVESVAAQASVGGSLPAFSAEVVVPKLTENQLKTIKMGMSAKIAIPVRKKPEIMVPLYAVITKNGKQFVKIIDADSGQQKEVPVVTGETTLKDIAITSGLKAGDKVVLSN